MKRKLLFIAMFCFIIFASCSAEDVGNFTSKPVYAEKLDTVSESIDENSPQEENVVVAHRGAWKMKKLPDNSIASLREAIRLKCKGSEFDIQLTADDSIVVCHDQVYNNLKVQNSKYADLISFKRSNGERLPTLREYIIAGKKNNTSTLLFCEFKDAGLSFERRKLLVNKTLQCVNELNAKELVVYICFNIYLLRPLRELDPLANLQYLNNDRSPEQLAKDKINGVDFNFAVFDSHKDWIESAKANGLNLNVWIVNDSERMDFYLKNNFDYITTDEPELLLNMQKNR